MGFIFVLVDGGKCLRGWLRRHQRAKWTALNSPSATPASTAPATASAPPPPPPPPPPPSIDGVLRYKVDLAGTGANLSETTLTTANVNVSSFGRLSKSAHLDGSIYTQPLFVRNLAMADGTHNVIFVGTENDSVYALDAEDPTQSFMEAQLH